MMDGHATHQSIQQSLVELWTSAGVQCPKQGLFLASTAFSIWPFTQLAFLLQERASLFECFPHVCSKPGLVNDGIFSVKWRKQNISAFSDLSTVCRTFQRQAVAVGESQSPS
jgi:hypothetical protein